MSSQTHPHSMDAESEDGAEKAQQAAGQAQAKVREQLDQRSTELAGQVDQQASDLRSVSEALRDQGKDRPAEVVDRLVGYAEQAGRYLRDKDAEAMLDDAGTSVARSRRWSPRARWRWGSPRHAS
jgi:uncharacterized protein YjbJ (UPF0337 family)